MCWEALRTHSHKSAIWKRGGGYLKTRISNGIVHTMSMENKNSWLVQSYEDFEIWGRRVHCLFVLEPWIDIHLSTKTFHLQDLIRVESDFAIIETKCFSWWYVFIVQTLHVVLIFYEIIYKFSLWGTWPGFVLNILPKFESLYTTRLII